jgi:hypothetical protein
MQQINKKPPTMRRWGRRNSFKDFFSMVNSRYVLIL